MKAFICVYRHLIPNNADIKRTIEIADKKKPAVHMFLAAYNKDSCFYDWGDDPAFFSAKEYFGDWQHATWGICRRDVRCQLSKGDLVIYFCGKQQSTNLKIWDYYFIGFGTVADLVFREQIWRDNRYAIYREFLNVLAKPENGGLVQYEFFGKGHQDWDKRITAPYVIFDQQNTDFNLDNPLRVATKSENSPIESWNSGNNELAKWLEKSLFIDFGITRRLRTQSEQHAHRHIPIHAYIPKDKQTEQLQGVQNVLSEIACSVRNMEK